MCSSDLKVSPLDNFFQLGGHSLLPIKLNKELKEKLNVVVDLGLIFEKPVLRDFSNKVKTIEGIVRSEERRVGKEC